MSSWTLEDKILPWNSINHTLYTLNSFIYIKNKSTWTHILKHIYYPLFIMPNFYNFLWIDCPIMLYYIMGIHFLLWISLNKLTFNTKLCDYFKHFFLRKGFLKPVSHLYKEALALPLRNYTVTITQGLSETPI